MTHCPRWSNSRTRLDRSGLVKSGSVFREISPDTGEERNETETVTMYMRSHRLPGTPDPRFRRPSSVCAAPPNSPKSGYGDQPETMKTGAEESQSSIADIRPRTAVSTSIARRKRQTAGEEARRRIKKTITENELESRMSSTWKPSDAALVSSSSPKLKTKTKTKTKALSQTQMRRRHAPTLPSPTSTATTTRSPSPFQLNLREEQTAQHPRLRSRTLALGVTMLTNRSRSLDSPAFSPREVDDDVISLMSSELTLPPLLLQEEEEDFPSPSPCAERPSRSSGGGERPRPRTAVSEASIWQGAPFVGGGRGSDVSLCSSSVCSERDAADTTTLQDEADFDEWGRRKEVEDAVGDDAQVHILRRSPTPEVETPWCPPPPPPSPPPRTMDRMAQTSARSSANTDTTLKWTPCPSQPPSNQQNTNSDSKSAAVTMVTDNNNSWCLWCKSQLLLEQRRRKLLIGLALLVLLIICYSSLLAVWRYSYSCYICAFLRRRGIDPAWFYHYHKWFPWFQRKPQSNRNGVLGSLNRVIDWIQYGVYCFCLSRAQLREWWEQRL